MGRGRIGGHPHIVEIGTDTRWPAIAADERSVAVSLRIPESQLAALDALPGARADKIRQAIALLLNQHPDTQKTS
ncbi:MAG: hypothetical protein H7Y37_19780 [Anaerolineae bacterium]|nr:hypothetical protein [Gloeobacterales cyanobacterium ES-bin-313]